MLAAASALRGSTARCEPRGAPPIVGDPVFHPEGAPLVTWESEREVRCEKLEITISWYWKMLEEGFLSL